MSDPIAPTLTFIDNPHSPAVFCDSVSGFFLLNGVISLTLESARVDHSQSPGPVNRVVVGRIQMSVPAAQGLALGLFDFLKQQGLDPAHLVKAGQSVQ
ncbi:MAG TPA: hypothetical protein VGF71_13740 [Caulobacteraceae bacterium]|jgi:hypothetical protein